MSCGVVHDIEHASDTHMADHMGPSGANVVCDETVIEAANERLGVIAGHLNAVNAALVDATVELLSTGAWQQGRHHKLHHLGQLGISGNADEFDGLMFTDQHGLRVAGSGTATQPTGPPPSPKVAYEPPLAGRFDWNWIGLGWIHPNAQRKRIDQARHLSARHRAAA